MNYKKVDFTHQPLEETINEQEFPPLLQPETCSSKKKGKINIKILYLHVGDGREKRKKNINGTEGEK